MGDNGMPALSENQAEMLMDAHAFLPFCYCFIWHDMLQWQ
jgi:hypothetical protein